MIKGDIVLIPFPFSDLSGSKTRPALLLITGPTEITLAFISTQLNRIDGNDILLKPSDANGLKRDSILRLSKLATLDRDLALGRLGTVDSRTLKQVNKNLIKIFKLED
ncbi:MAG: type II toxin-antitoxin system PemK/MazF family toxin [Lentimicrobium sp.]|jgi:mRNA interferase MazF|nr:type II toxin-antitoxin system PemK/MazF family toxin [Lentimicrobium sp.]